jgi:hypothetical protein
MTASAYAHAALDRSAPSIFDSEITGIENGDRAAWARNSPEPERIIALGGLGSELATLSAAFLMPNA